MSYNVSWAMLFYNEEECIETALKCFGQFTREIIAVDTGSTDGTRDIVKKYTDKIYDWDFKDRDFAKARNFSLSKCTSSWIMMIDPDEWLEEDDFEKFGNVLLHADSPDNPGYDAFRFPRYNWLDKEKTKEYPVSGAKDPQTRLYKNNGVIKYALPIHEVIVGAKKTCFVQNVGIQHGHWAVKASRRQHMDEIYNYYNNK